MSTIAKSEAKNIRILTEQDTNKIDASVIDTVFGYTRNAASLLNYRKHIPAEIAFICLSFYYWDANEYFANAHHGVYRIVKTEKEISAEKTVYLDDGSAFGNVLIQSQFGGVYTWKFKMWCLRIDIMCIGISTEYSNTTVNFDENQFEDIGYNYSMDEIKSFERNNAGGANDDDIPWGHYRDGGFVTMTLDLNQRTLKYEFEDMFDIEDAVLDDIACGPGINYKMAFSACHEEDKIQLLDFSVERDLKMSPMSITDEYFANVHSDYRVLNLAGNISVEQRRCNGNGAAFGSVLIQSQQGGVYVWKFKICKGEVCTIGISTEYEDTERYFSNQEIGHNYSINHMDSFSYFDDGIVTMKLNLNHRTLYFQPDREYGCKYGLKEIVCGPGINYKMAYSSWKKGDKIQLLEFSIED